MQSVQREKDGAAIALGHVEHAQSGRAVFGGPQCGPSSVQHLSALGMRPEVAAPVAAQIEEEVSDGGEPHLDGCAEGAREAADRWIGVGSRITPVHGGVDRIRIRWVTEAAAAPRSYQSGHGRIATETLRDDRASGAKRSVYRLGVVASAVLAQGPVASKGCNCPTASPAVAGEYAV